MVNLLASQQFGGVMPDHLAEVFEQAMDGFRMSRLQVAIGDPCAPEREQVTVRWQ